VTDGTPAAFRRIMPGSGHRQVAFALVAVGVLAAASRESRAAEGDVEASGTPKVIREWVGVEVTPASFSLARGESRPGEGSARLQGGPGGGIRLFRHRWAQAYFTPIQAGLYVSSGDEVIYAHIEPEGGVVVPGTDRRLELGLGLGLSVLAIKYGTGCDGDCYAGGAGVTASPVARYLWYTTPFAAMGLSLRALIPVVPPIGDGPFGSTRWGSAVLVGLEIGFGRQ